MMQWPPHFIIKKHPRARQVKIRVSEKNGLTLTVPPTFRAGDAASILEKHKNWIIKKFSECRRDDHALPTELTFHAIQETWRVHYITAESKLKLIANANYELTFVGRLENNIYVKKYLCAWIKNYAKKKINHAA